MRRLRHALLAVCAIAAGATGTWPCFAAERSPTKDLPREIRVYDTAKWQFDARTGYRYVANLQLHETRIRDGKVFACRTALVTNRYGFPGRSVATGGDFRIALFGGTWTAFYVDGRTIADELADRLSADTGRHIVVSNRSRESSGVIGMTVGAVPTLRFGDFDLAVIAFTTDDLDRAAHWQYHRVINGEDRALVTDSLAVDPAAGGSHVADAYLIDRRATAAWCAATKGRRDAVVADTEARYRRLIRPGRAPRLAVTELKDNPLFRLTMEHMEWLGTRVALIHLPTPDEIARPGPLSLLPKQAAQMDSFERAWARRALRTLPKLRAAGADPGKMAFSDTDPHPSRNAMERYAAAMAAALEDAGLVPARQP